uniref:Galactosylgalactosylxylosylprotein 3-beta-glucuronosyltransferase n=1 Tax=Plectus sambesii TaxID=2011161 RepID=A0A914VQL5_9BILA
MADLTRFSQTLRLVPKVHWIVVEDSSSRSENIELLLSRSTISHTLLWRKTPPHYPGKGWLPRSYALDFIRNHFRDQKDISAVVFFGDDDNAYDLRLFTDYIRHVDSVGVWAVGLVGGAIVEAPKVDNGTVIGWNVLYAPRRKFATDMAGFAVHLNLILSTNATFGPFCRRKSAPETCFLEQLGITLKDLKPFGFDNDRKEILVWHTKTRNSGTKGDNYGFVV